MKCVCFLEALLIFGIFASGLLCNANKITKRTSDHGNNVEVTEEWFGQYLNHFSPADRRKWQQRYFTNGEHYKPEGPVFLMVGGESEAEIEWMTNGAWIDYAKRFGALCVMLEHRYFGKSRPTEDTSIHNLQYLTIEQALADLAIFIVSMNDKFGLGADTKWIAFGGSYPGALAAWLRLKYPHLVHGVVSSSGVLLSKVDFSDYFRVIAEDLKTCSDECENIVREGTLEVGVLLRHKEGQQALNEKFRLCEPVEKSENNEKDISLLYFTLALNFGFIQAHKVNYSFLPHNLGVSNITIDMVCDILTNKSKGSPMDRLADVNTLMLRLKNSTCLEYNYEKLIYAGRNTSWDAPRGDFAQRMWFFLQCTGFTDFQTSSFERETFGNKFPVEFYIQMCIDFFGPEYNSTYIRNMAHSKKTTDGGLDFNTTNVLFVHGSVDPWHPGGITRNVSHGPPVIFIEGTAHVADMVPETDDDLPQLKAARKQIAEYIDNWLQQ